MAAAADNGSARARLGALCACGPLGLAGSDDAAALQLLAGLLLGRVQRVDDRLRVAFDDGAAVELRAVPETDWLAWERLCAGFERRRVEPAPACARRLLCFRAVGGPLPEICESPARCLWTRRWLVGDAEDEALSAAAKPMAPRSAW